MPNYIVSGEARDASDAPQAGVTVRAIKRSDSALLGQTVSSDGNPIDGDLNYANRLLILNMNGANGSTVFVDQSSFSRTVTSNSGAAITTLRNKFGGACGDFSVGTESLTLAANSAFAFGTGDFTVEAFIWFNGAPGNSAIFDLGSVNSGGGLGLFFDGSTLIVRIGGLGNDFSCGSFDSEFLNTWVHIAMVRQSGVITVYRNGVSIGSATRTQDVTQSSVHIGQLGGFGYFFNGWMDSFRISNIAEYTASFTPPAVEFKGFANQPATPLGSFSINLGETDPGELQIVFMDPDGDPLQNDIIQRAFAVEVAP